MTISRLDSTGRIVPASAPRPPDPRRLHAWTLASRAQRLRVPWCEECGSLRDLTADHVVPLARGGRLLDGPLRTLCRGCNARRGAAA